MLCVKVILYLVILFYTTSCNLHARIYSLSNISSDSTNSNIEKSQVTFSTSDIYSLRTSSFEVIVTFPENYSEFKASDLQVSNGSILQISGGPKVYVVKIDPISIGQIFINLNSNLEKTFNLSESSQKDFYYDTSNVTVSLVQESELILEGTTELSFTFTTSAARPYEVPIQYEVFGTALLGIDHDLFNGVVIVPANQTSVVKTFRILQPIQTSLKSVGVRIVSVLKENFYLGSAIYSIKKFYASHMPLVTHFSGISNHYCYILKPSGELKCWGNNNLGQIGNGTTDLVSIPVTIDAGVSYSKIAPSFDSMTAFTCGVTTLNKLKCWGNNSVSQLGNGNTTSALTPQIIDVANDYKDVCTGMGHACAISLSGSLNCWGSDSSGQLGNGASSNQTSPMLIDAGTNYSSLSCGAVTTCGITDTGVLKCWGEDTISGIGLGTGIATGDKQVPTIVDSGITYAKVSIGWTYGCGITTGGILKCWGSNNEGQLGNGNLNSSTTPVLVSTSNLFIDIGVQGNSNLNSRKACAVTDSNRLYCWGAGVTIPQVKDDYNIFTHVFVGQYSLCSLTSIGGYSGILKCDMDIYKTKTSPENINTNETVTNIGLGHGRRFCRIKNEKLICTQSNSSANAIEFDPTTNYKQVSVGIESICGITTLNKLKCFGNNSYGNLGDGTIINRDNPVIIDELTSYKYVSMGNSHSCGITTTNKLRCWGSNTNGQLGDNSTTNRLSPVDVDIGNDYKFISA